MTLRNQVRNSRPARLLKQVQGPKRPRGSASAPSSVSRVSDGAPSGVPLPSGERKESQPSRPAVPPAPPRNDAPGNGSQAGNASNGSGASPGGGTASPTRFDRNTTRTIPVKEAAYRLKKHKDTIYVWLRTGRLRGWQLGGPGCAVMVCEESVEEALAGVLGTGRDIHAG